MSWGVCDVVLKSRDVQGTLSPQRSGERAPTLCRFEAGFCRM
jgi:hypothetical protein